MRVLFCKISSMKYYKGACDADMPLNGGSYVLENGYGHEEYNFFPFKINDDQDAYCMGFVEPKSNREKRNTLHLERIDGCELLKREPLVSNVLIVWCATRQQNDLTVVGWYNHATVLRELHEWTVTWADGSEEVLCYNVQAAAQNCVLLPESERNRRIWWVPTAKYTKSYGFGQAMVWYANEPEAEQFINKLLNSINSYQGENWLEKFPGD